jgi:hypothetical protein
MMSHVIENTPNSESASELYWFLLVIFDHCSYTNFRTGSMMFSVISNMHSRIFGFIHSYQHEIDGVNTELDIIACAAQLCRESPPETITI